MASVNSGSDCGPAPGPFSLPPLAVPQRGGNAQPKTGEHNSPLPRWHRIHTVRIQQGISLRTVARHTGLPLRTLKAQEVETADLRLSELYRWQRVLEVPASELLLETESPLSRPVQERAQLVRIMKTALSLKEYADRPAIKRLTDTLVSQLIQLMPELAHVAPWPTYGQRRTLDELGRVAEQPISEEWFLTGNWDED